MHEHVDAVATDGRPLRMIGRAVGCALLSIGGFVLLSAVILTVLMLLGAFLSCTLGNCPWETTPAQKARALEGINTFAAVFTGVAVGMLLIVRVTLPAIRQHPVVRTLVVGLVALAAVGVVTWLWLVRLYV